MINVNRVDFDASHLYRVFINRDVSTFEKSLFHRWVLSAILRRCFLYFQLSCIFVYKVFRILSAWSEMLFSVHRRDAQHSLTNFISLVRVSFVCIALVASWNRVGRINRVGSVLLCNHHLYLVWTILTRLHWLLRDETLALRRAQRAVDYVFENWQEISFVLNQGQDLFLFRVQLLRRAVVIFWNVQEPQRIIRFLQQL